MSGDQQKLMKEELRLMCQRVKLLDSYVESLGDSGGDKKQATNRVGGTQTLPTLSEALSLDIPSDVKQRILISNSNSMQNRSNSMPQFGFTLGLTQQLANCQNGTIINIFKKMVDMDKLKK